MQTGKILLAALLVGALTGCAGIRSLRTLRKPAGSAPAEARAVVTRPEPVRAGIAANTLAAHHQRWVEQRTAQLVNIGVAAPAAANQAEAEFREKFPDLIPAAPAR